MKCLCFGKVLILSTYVWSVMSVPACSKQQDQFFNKTSEQCEICPSCAIGTGRDFKKMTVQVEDECLPCQTCNPGYYSTKTSNRCRKCRKSCSKSNRQTVLKCTGDHEIVCGSCLSGYRDEYSSTDLPCKKIPSVEIKKTSTPPERTKQPPERTPPERSKSTADRRQNETAGPVALENKQPPSESSMFQIGGPVLVVVLIVSAILAVTGVIYLVRRPSLQNRQLIDSRSSSGASIETKAEVNPEDMSLLMADTPEVDGPGQSFAMVTESRVQKPVPHPELSSIRTNGPDALSPGSSTSNVLNVARYECGHLKRPRYGPINDDYDDVVVKGDKYLRCVATNVCHEPDVLYRELGIPYHKVFQNQDDRNVDPEHFPLDRVVLNNLNSWIEDQGSQKLSTLLSALYRSSFDNIVQKICTMYDRSTEKIR